MRVLGWLSSGDVDCLCGKKATVLVIQNGGILRFCCSECSAGAKVGILSRFSIPPNMPKKSIVEVITWKVL